MAATCPIGGACADLGVLLACAYQRLKAGCGCRAGGRWREWSSPRSSGCAPRAIPVVVAACV